MSRQTNPRSRPQRPALSPSSRPRNGVLLQSPPSRPRRDSPSRSLSPRRNRGNRSRSRSPLPPRNRQQLPVHRDHNYARNQSQSRNAPERVGHGRSRSLSHHDDENDDPLGENQSSNSARRPSAPVTSRGKPRQRRKAKKTDPKNKLSILIRKARNLSRPVTPFHDIGYVIDFGLGEIEYREEKDLEVNDDDPEGDVEGDESEEDRLQSKRLWRAFCRFCLLPSMWETISSFSESEDLENFASDLQQSARSASDADRANMKQELLRHLELPPPDPLFLRMKANRGWGSPATARLLCPVRLLADYDANPISFRERVLNGSIKISHEDLPLFLYDEALIDGENLEKGLFCGYLFLIGFKLIFTSVSSLYHDSQTKRVSRPSNAEIHEMTKASPYECAYVAVLIWFTLSSLENWKCDDPSFSMPDFYYTLLDIFLDENARNWSTTTLDFISKYKIHLSNLLCSRHCREVFRTEARIRTRVTTPIVPSATSSLSLLRQMRDRRIQEEANASSSRESSPTY